MRTIIVQQDAALGQLLARSLKQESNDAEWVADGETALARCELLDVDLMVLDLHLPGITGLDVLQVMQGRFTSCSLIVLLSEDLIETRVRCLDLGADDCIMKPFSLQELTARCRAQLRRRARLSGATLEHGDLILRRRDRSAARAGVAVELTAKEFSLLEFLVERRGRCASRIELLRQVFHLPETSPTNVVEVYINYLRRKLSAGELASAPPLIETVRGFGYRVAEPTPAISLASSPAVQDLSRKRQLQAISI